MRCSDKIIELGFIDKGTGKHQSNIVYGSGGVAPCVTANFGYKQPPTMIVVKDKADGETTDMCKI